MKNVSRFLSPKIAKLLSDREGVTAEQIDALPEHVQDVLSGILSKIGSVPDAMVERQLPAIGKIVRGEVSFDPMDYTWIEKYVVTVLPVEWKMAEITIDGAAYQATDGRRVILSGQMFSTKGRTVMVDGLPHVVAPILSKERWLHLSMSASYGQKLPSWRQLVEAKELFLGRESRAIQVISPRSEYVNINPSVLHLWVCLDREFLPDFTYGSGSL